MPAGPPFDDLRRLIADLPERDDAAFDAIRGDPRLAGLGRLADVAAWWGAWRGVGASEVRRPMVALYVSAFVFAGEDASARAASALAALGAEGRAGPAALIARAAGAGVEAFDLALQRPVPDAAVADAMSPRECAATIAFGMEAVAKSPDLLVLSDRTEGSARAALAVAAALGLGADLLDLDAAWARAAAARAGARGPLETLAALGGREAAAMLGALVAARSEGVPVILDGPAALVAALVLAAERPGAADHARAADVGVGAGAWLGVRLASAPLFQLAAPASGGAGGAAAIGLVKAAAALLAKA